MCGLRPIFGVAFPKDSLMNNAKTTTLDGRLSPLAERRRRVGMVQQAIRLSSPLGLLRGSRKSSGLVGQALYPVGAFASLFFLPD